LGSNIEPEKNLPDAVLALSDSGRVAAVSEVYESAPVGFADQPNFLNAAVLLETPLSARELRFEAIAKIEGRLGRVRDPQNKNAPRPIDIDIALFNRDVLHGDGLSIPDPNILDRLFVARPLAELEPDYIHPETGRTLREIAASLEPTSGLVVPRPDAALRDFIDPEPVPTNFDRLRAQSGAVAWTWAVFQYLRIVSGSLMLIGPPIAGFYLVTGGAQPSLRHAGKLLSSWQFYFCLVLMWAVFYLLYKVANLVTRRILRRLDDAG
jgi:2-amino-4-hydroxy-6-hydroxymethyldihydropteridine diphosphokinase